MNSNIVNVFKLDDNNIIIHIRCGNMETTTNHCIPWNSIRILSVDGDRVLIYHNHKQSIFNINGDQSMIDIETI